MANIKSSIKDIRRTKKRTLYNSRTKNRVKKIRVDISKSLSSNDTKNIQDKLVLFQKQNSKAAKKRVIKKKTASRRISRMAKRINNLSSANAKSS